MHLANTPRHVLGRRSPRQDPAQGNAGKLASTSRPKSTQTPLSPTSYAVGTERVVPGPRSTNLRVLAKEDLAIPRSRPRRTRARSPHCPASWSESELFEPIEAARISETFRMGVRLWASIPYSPCRPGQDRGRSTERYGAGAGMSRPDDDPSVSRPELRRVHRSGICGCLNAERCKRTRPCRMTLGIRPPVAPQDLIDDHFAYAAQAGVETMEARLQRRCDATFEHLEGLSATR